VVIPKGGELRVLADELFLIGWDTTASGKPRMHLQGIELGLAGALIAELVIAGCVAVRGSTLGVRDGTPAAEEVAGRILAEMRGLPQHADVRTWLVYLARRAVAEVGGRMVLAGLLTREEPKFFKRQQSRFHATDSGAAAWPRTRLHMALTRWQPLTPGDMALIALVEACGMTGVVVEDPVERRAARRHLTAVLAALPQPIADLAGHVEAATGDAVLTYRT
jgi:hypothetical protein